MQSWKNVEQFKKKVDTLLEEGIFKEDIPKLDFDSMTSNEFIDYLFRVVHPFEQKGITKIISPVQKAMTIAIYQNNDWASEEQLVQFIAKHWDDIKFVSKQHFIRDPDFRLIHMNLAIKKNDQYLFVKSPDDPTLISVNYDDPLVNPKRTYEHKSNSNSDNEGGIKPRDRKSHRKHLSDSYDDQIEEDLFSDNEARLGKKKAAGLKKKGKGNDSSSDEVAQGQTKANIQYTKSPSQPTEILTNSMLAGGPHVVPLINAQPGRQSFNKKSDESKDLINPESGLSKYLIDLDIPLNIQFQDKILYIIQKSSHGLSLEQIIFLINKKNISLDDGIFVNLPLKERVRAILLNFKFQSIVKEEFIRGMEVWIEKKHHCEKNPFDHQMMHLNLPKKLPYLRIKELTISQMYEKYSQKGSFLDKK